MDRYTFQYDADLSPSDPDVIEHEVEYTDEIICFFFRIEYEPEGCDSDGEPTGHHHTITVGPAVYQSVRERVPLRTLRAVMARWPMIEEELADEAAEAAERVAEGGL